VQAYINRIATVVPPYEVHRKFLSYVPRMLQDPRARKLLERMSDRAGIEARYSYTHDKVFLVDAVMNGRRQLVTFTGSHNWTKDASDSNDELLVRSAAPEVYGAMAGHLIQQWAKSSTLKPKM